MKCYYCDQPMTSGSAKFDTWGNRTVCAHRTCDRQSLLTRAYEMGVIVVPEERTDQELIDALAAERLSGEWLDRLEKLPTDEAKRDAVHRLRLSMDNPT